MKIFNTYTGNAMLNNALMTIEALGNLNDVSEITPETLLSLYKGKDLKNLNKRLKSYTMLFTKNGPLKNDKNNGDTIYDEIFYHIITNFQNKGSKTCEISGLHYEKSFEELFNEILKKIGLNDKEIKKKDTTINRSWFPLIGGLGSDAQALPQAKFTVQIHPICIPIMQFLPLSALLYKGGVLLIDSSNFEFAKAFVENSVKEVQKRIQTTSVNDSIENIKDFAKGNYLLKAIEILEEKEMEEEYSDLNLWSFSNSGTGASCEIDRVPNELIKKLIRLKANIKISNEVKEKLNNTSAYSFLEALENKQEWYLLYPNVFGTGKKKTEYEGVSSNFLEAYFKEINSLQKTEYAKYLAYLIDKYKTDTFDKYLGKRDAYKEQQFHTDLYAVLVKATEQGKWDLAHHFEILDNPNAIPIKNNFYQILKITHFYYYKKAFSSQIPSLRLSTSGSQKTYEWLIALIQQDAKKESLIKDLLSSQNYSSTSYTNLFYRVSQNPSIDLESVFYALFSENYRQANFGINGLLRIFFSQSQQPNFEIKILQKSEQWELDRLTHKWFSEIQDFSQDYQAYYFDKYENKETGFKPYSKFINLVNAISNEGTKFLIWFYEAIENTNEFLQNGEKSIPDKWSESLLYNPYGEYSLSFARFAIKFSLLKQYQKTYQTT